MNGVLARVGWHGGAALAVWLDALFPPRCVGCNRMGAHFCATCVAALRPVRPPWCESCGATIAHPPDGPPHPPDGPPAGATCADCRLERLPLAGVRSGAVFNGPLRPAVYRLKYRGRTGAATVLAGLLAAPARELLASIPAETALVVPVPLHPSRQRERGYNQSALLARPLAAALSVTYRPDALERVKATPPQVGLTRRQRRANLRDAFHAGPCVSGQVVLLVDDVTTTGSTLASAARACLDVGARQVYAVTLGREV